MSFCQTFSNSAMKKKKLIALREMIHLRQTKNFSNPIRITAFHSKHSHEKCLHSN